MTLTEAIPSRTETSPAPDWLGKPFPNTPEGWIERARQVAQVLAVDAVARDHANQSPQREVELLKEAGLTPIFAPVEYGGGGQEWTTAYKVIREVAAGDSSIGQLLAYHYMWSWLPRLIGTPEQIDRLDREVAEQRLFCAGAVNARDADVLIRDEGDHLVLNGKKNFATGVRIADITCVEGVIEGTDTHVFVNVRSDQPGMAPAANWDNMGQRLTESGSLTITDVRGEWRDALGFVDKVFTPRPYGTMMVPLGQLAFASFWLGIARGALDNAIAYTKQHGSAWGGYARTIDEPRVLDTIGDLTAKLWAAEALIDAVAEEGLALHRDPDAVTDRMRGEYKIRSAAVKARCDDVVLEVTNRIFEVTGARSTATRYGFDRFWKDVRTHTLHDPVAYQRLEIGRFQLHDEVPEPGWYS